MADILNTVSHRPLSPAHRPLEDAAALERSPLRALARSRWRGRTVACRRPRGRDLRRRCLGRGRARPARAIPRNRKFSRRTTGPIHKPSTITWQTPTAHVLDSSASNAEFGDSFCDAPHDQIGWQSSLSRVSRLAASLVSPERNVISTKDLFAHATELHKAGRSMPPWRRSPRLSRREPANAPAVPLDRLHPKPARRV